MRMLWPTELLVFIMDWNDCGELRLVAPVVTSVHIYQSTMNIIILKDCLWYRLSVVLFSMCIINVSLVCVCTWLRVCVVVCMCDGVHVW